MGFLNWIKGEVCRGSNSPCEGDEITTAEWKAMRTTFPDGTMQGGNCSGGPVAPKPPIKPQPTGGRLIYGNRDPGPVLAFAEGRRQAQSFKLPPPGADPVATDEDLIVVATGPVWSHHAYRAIYERGRADERTAILRALGVEP